jgi:hypothetical protein
MAKATPGPWALTGDNSLQIVEWPGGPAELGYCIAKCVGGLVRPTETAMANARLIAAAPDLLAHAQADISELKYFINNPSAWAHFDEDMSERLRAVVARARAAISNATGESAA